MLQPFPRHLIRFSVQLAWTCQLLSREPDIFCFLIVRNQSPRSHRSSRAYINWKTLQRYRVWVVVSYLSNRRQISHVSQRFTQRSGFIPPLFSSTFVDQSLNAFPSWEAAASYSTYLSRLPGLLGEWCSASRPDLVVMMGSRTLNCFISQKSRGLRLVPAFEKSRRNL